MDSEYTPEDGFWYTVEPGDWVSKIAERFGFPDWKRVWNDPQNADLRDLRPDPNVICPGDEIYIPPIAIKEADCSTDQVHKFQLKTTRKKLKIVLRDADGEPRKDEPCELVIDHQPVPDVKKTNQVGLIEAMIPNTAQRGTLMIGPDRAEVYELLLGHLDPIETVKGYQQRLANLGYYTGENDGLAGPLTKKAVRGFQEFENQRAGKQVLVVDGIMGPKTTARLKDFHGY